MRKILRKKKYLVLSKKELEICEDLEEQVKKN